MISLDYLREMTSDKWIVLSTIANGVNLVKVHPNKFGNLESSVMKGQHNGTLKKKRTHFLLDVERRIQTSYHRHLPLPQHIHYM